MGSNKCLIHTFNLFFAEQLRALKHFLLDQRMNMLSQLVCYEVSSKYGIDFGDQISLYFLRDFLKPILEGLYLLAIVILIVF